MHSMIFGMGYNNPGHIAPAKDFKLTDADFNDFKTFLSDKKYDYQTASEKALEDFKKKAEDEKYFEAVQSQYQQLKQNLTRDKQADLEKNKSEIIELLESEIAKRYYFQKAEFEMAAKHDEDVKLAIKLLNDLPRYNSILGKKQ
jgi:carboxyl-terminal processing protease